MSDTVIAAAARVQAFLDDEAVVEAFERVEKSAYDAFKKSTSDDEMRAARASIKAVEELKTQLRVTLDRGTRARADAEREESRGPRRPNGR